MINFDYNPNINSMKKLLLLVMTKLTVAATFAGEAKPDILKRLNFNVMSDVSSIIPKHGTASIKPEERWEEAFAEMRRIIGEQSYAAGQKFFLQISLDTGWGVHLVWTDAFQPGFFLELSQLSDRNISNYARFEDFATGGSLGAVADAERRFRTAAVRYQNR